MVKIGEETCSDILLIDGIGRGIDVFEFASFNTEEGGALIAFCVAFTKRLGLSG